MGLCLTQSAMADDLPPVWHDLAAASKWFEGTTIDHAIVAMVLTLGISPDMAPLCHAIPYLEDHLLRV
jgi:hypothetical protein